MRSRYNEEDYEMIRREGCYLYTYIILNGLHKSST
jgi:hypothetical protein